ncbi:hypothetical protein CHUAL_001413 [Chamberlinius hualienensis]
MMLLEFIRSLTVHLQYICSCANREEIDDFGAGNSDFVRRYLRAFLGDLVIYDKLAYQSWYFVSKGLKRTYEVIGVTGFKRHPKGVHRRGDRD